MDGHDAVKHSTPDSMKFKRLKRRLALPTYQVVGLLELLWIATQKNSPRGDIGRFDDEAIAVELDWAGCPAELIKALVETGWLDADPIHRLLVHGWSEHAPRYIHGIMARADGFAVQTTVGDCSTPLQSPTVVKPQLTDSGQHAGARLPNLTKPKTSVINYQLSEALAKTGKTLLSEWHQTTGKPLQFDDATGTEPSVFPKLTNAETLKDPSRMHDWWRYQLGCQKPVTGPECGWCVLVLALGLHYSRKSDVEIGKWKSAVGKGWWTAAGPYIERAELLLRPVIFQEKSNAERQ